jgi:hypothetical protein
MQTDLAYCRLCDSQVRVTLTPAPTHEGQANLPDAPELLCLDVQERCLGGTCPLSNLPRHVMAVRLARSHLPGEAPTTAGMRCGACGQVAEMEVVDRTTLLCTVCGSPNRGLLLEMMERGWVVADVE